MKLFGNLVILLAVGLARPVGKIVSDNHFHEDSFHVRSESKGAVPAGPHRIDVPPFESGLLSFFHPASEVPTEPEDDDQRRIRSLWDEPPHDDNLHSLPRPFRLGRRVGLHSKTRNDPFIPREASRNPRARESVLKVLQNARNRTLLQNPPGERSRLYIHLSQLRCGVHISSKGQALLRTLPPGGRLLRSTPSPDKHGPSINGSGESKSTRTQSHQLRASEGQTDVSTRTGSISSHLTSNPRSKRAILR